MGMQYNLDFYKDRDTSISKIQLHFYSGNISVTVSTQNIYPNYIDMNTKAKNLTIAIYSKLI